MIDRPESYRIPPVTEVDGETAEVLSKALSHDGRTLNIFGVLANHPKLLKRFNLFGGFLLNKGLVPERERELVILRVGANCRSRYEFGQHTVIGDRCGVTPEEVVALVRPAGDHAWSDQDRVLIDLADELCADDCISDDTFARLRTSWSEAQVIELLVTAGFYRLVSGFLNSTGVELDDGIPGFPEEPSITS